jgi:thiosulfate dehydrogenase [quinone] large subunit
MNKNVTYAAVALRLLMGWFMFFDGLSILQTPGWSAKGFLLAAKTFPEFYAWFALPMNTWWVDPLNSWGITLIGAALLLGVFVRPAAWAGLLMMVLYYFPHNVFPYVTYGYIVEEHVIYGAVFALIAMWPLASRFGLSGLLKKSVVGRLPLVEKIL